MWEDIWPSAGEKLLRELRETRGRVALVRSVGPLTEVVAKLAELVQQDPTSVGSVLAELAEPPAASDAANVLRGRHLLVDLDVLFWPGLQVDPLALLRRLAANDPVVAVWPGAITGRHITYSEPGRPDHYDTVLRDALVLTPLQVAFPDEVPYELERIPA